MNMKNWIQYLTEKPSVGGAVRGDSLRQKTVAFLDKHRPGWRATVVRDFEHPRLFDYHAESADVAQALFETASDEELDLKGIRRERLLDIVMYRDTFGAWDLRYHAQVLGSILGRRAAREEYFERRREEMRGASHG